jgi:dTMP kinase
MFVTLEGPEGGGKSTIMRLMGAGLQDVRMVRTREPGDGPLGMQIRHMLLHGENINPATELFLFLADRAQHVSELIRPALEDGAVVVCDRFTDSTLAYQGYGRGVDIELLRRLNDLATDGLKPDLTLLLDIPPEQGLARQTNKDRLDREPLEFHKKIRNGFLTEAAKEPARWELIDASKDIEQVVADCDAAILRLLKT